MTKEEIEARISNLENLKGDDFEKEASFLKKLIDELPDDPPPKKSDHCKDREKCLREINPEEHPGIYFGEAFQYDPDFHGCYLCDRYKETGHNDSVLCPICGGNWKCHDEDGNCVYQ